MKNILNVSLGEKAPDAFNVIIEISRGSSNKYEIDKDTGLLKLDRVLYSPFYYPLDYGFLPQTHWHDGDPLDALVLVTHPILPGTIVEARPVGVIRMMDNGDKDEKIIAVATGDPRFNEYEDIDDLSVHLRKELKHFYEYYKHLEGKEVKVISIEGKKEAKEVIVEGIELYKQLQAKK
ncbi:MAG: inorganic diphosphatase [Patescibacteria group bacterium]